MVELPSMKCLIYSNFSRLELENICFQCNSMSTIVNALLSDGWAHSSFIIENIWNLIRFCCHFLSYVFIYLVLASHLDVPDPPLVFAAGQGLPFSSLVLGSILAVKGKWLWMIFDRLGLMDVAGRNAKSMPNFRYPFWGKLPEEDLISTFG